MKPTQWLFVEDDPYLGTIIQDLLTMEGFEVRFFKNYEAALEDYRSNKPQLCLLDVMLPGMIGFEIGRIIRTLDKQIPILFLTAKSQKEDIIEGFTAGADDYLKKPFSMEELVLRIRALLRRCFPDQQPRTEQAIYEFGNYQFLYLKKILHYQGSSHELTCRECEMLRMLCENRNQLINRSLILKQIWGDDSYFNARSMDVFLAKLRKHFHNNPNVSIVNVRGQGFILLVQE